MKKISKWTRFSFIILMFLFVSFTSAAQADNLLKAASPNPAFVTWQKNAQPSANNGSPAANYGYAPSPVNWRHLDNVTYGINGRASFTKQSKAALPAVYDLRGKMPSMRPRLTVRPAGVTLCTRPITISPSRSLNWLN